MDYENNVIELNSYAFPAHIPNYVVFREL